MGADGGNLLARLRSMAATKSREVMESAARGLDPAASGTLHTFLPLSISNHRRLHSLKPACPGGAGQVSAAFFSQFLSFLNFGLSEQEQETIARQFAFTGPGAAPGTVRLGEFIDALTLP